MKEKFYGRIEQVHVEDDVARYAEEVSLRGFAIIPDLFSQTSLENWREKIDSVYEKQESEFGRDALEAIQELDVCRAPLLYDLEFLQLAMHPFVMSLIKFILGDYFILNLQNAIINRPDQEHHQSSWHRDLPYQNFVISRPLAINALIAIDNFSGETGGTQLVPFSHKTEILPSDEYINSDRFDATISAGSVIIFDSMLFHRAGRNKSKADRRAVNHLYTSPILKQQYDFPRALGESLDMAPELMRFLGYDSQVPVNDVMWRKARTNKMLQAE